MNIKHISKFFKVWGLIPPFDFLITLEYFSLGKNVKRISLIKKKKKKEEVVVIHSTEFSTRVRFLGKITVISVYV